jgi:hypothetical protein
MTEWEWCWMLKMSEPLMAQVAQCSLFAVPPYIGALNSSCQIEVAPQVVSAFDSLCLRTLSHGRCAKLEQYIVGHRTTNSRIWHCKEDIQMGVWLINKGDAYLVNMVYKCGHSGLQPLHHLPVLELWHKWPLYPVLHHLKTDVRKKPKFQFFFFILI